MRSTVGGNLATISCSLANTVAGNTIVVNGFDYGASNSVSGTESLTCPGAASIYHNYNGGGNHGTYICYVATASSHATFTVTSTLTCGTCGGAPQLMAYEVSGLGAVDTPSAAAAFAKTVNFTTANPNEWAFCSGFDFADLLVPASAFSQVDQISAIFPSSSQADHLMAQFILTTTAGSYTASYTDTNSFPAPLIACIAFQKTGAPAPAVKIVQGCSWLGAGGNPTPVRCDLYNVVAGNKVVILGYDNAPGVANSLGTCAPETCVCPTSAGASHTYGTVFTTNICYVDLVSSHASLSVLLGTTGGGNAVGLMKVYEISGLAAGIDAGSVMAPGNSFGQLNYSTGNSSSYGHLGGLKFIPSAGSNTASYTQTGSTTPVIGVAAFDGGVGSTVRHRAQVI